jgi:periplasmic protein TonB
MIRLMNTRRSVRAAACLAATLALVLVVTGCASRNPPLQLVSGTGAVYPPEARAAGIEGYVVVRYDVGVDGRVGNVRVAAADPAGVFDESAVQAVSRWRFSEPLRDGVPAPVEGLESRLEFRLGGGDAYDDY